MAKRRGNQEGAIYERANGHWQAQISIDGRRLSRSFPSKKECLLWIKEITQQKEEGLSFLSANISLAEYLNQWLTSIKPNLRPKTWLQYEGIINNHLSPYLGRVKLIDLKPATLQALYTKKLEEGRGSRTVQLVHAVLHRSLGMAEKQGLIGRNPASKVEKPTIKRKEMAVLSDGEIRQMLFYAQGKQIGAILQLAVTTGMRQGEILGLKWSDVDWASSTIRVQRQLQRISGMGFVFPQPKTQSGVRTVQIGATTLKMLMAHKDAQDSQLGPEGNKQNLVFTSSIGTPKEPRVVHHEFKRILAEAHLPNMRFHDLRHTAASLMLMSGMQLIRIARQLGHSRPSITLDIYGHLIPGLENEAAQRLDELITPTIAAELQQISSEKK